MARQSRRTNPTSAVAGGPSLTGAVYAGAILGMMMASAFIAIGAVILMPYMDPKSARFMAFAQRRFSAHMVVMAVVAFYPLWAAIGALAGLVLVVFERAVPGAGLGSPNLAYTAALAGLAIMCFVPAGLMLKRSAPAVAALGLAFAGLYGWALPHFAE